MEGKGLTQLDKAKKMTKIAVAALEDKKGEEISIIDISGVSVMADYFIIANGTNELQVRALVESVEEDLEKAGYEKRQREGTHRAGWILLDFTDVIVHIFDKENRLFYDLERIWRDGKSVRIEDL